MRQVKIQELFSRSIKIDRASDVKNVYGQNMASYDGCVSMNNGVVAFIYKGEYYLTPDGYEAFKIARDELGLREASFMVLCSQRPQEQAPVGWERRWRFLRDTRH